MKTITVKFPSITAQEIYKKSKNKVGDDKLLWNIDWYKDEDFFTKEETRKGKREIVLEIQHLGRSWNECNSLKGSSEMLNFAEVTYLAWKYPEFRKLLEYKYTWTSSRASDGRLVDFGSSDADGAYVHGWTPGSVNGYLGVAFSRSLDSLNSESGNFDLENRVKNLEKDMEKIRKFLVF